MKLFLKQIKSHQLFIKGYYWFKLFSITGSAQVIVQGIGFLCGIIVIRNLPTDEYALYTLANTMLGTMTILSDGGITTGVMAQGGKVWQNPKKLGVVLASGFELRRKFAIISLIISSPILIYLLLHNGASWLMTILIILSIIPAFLAALSDSLLEIVPKLHQSILPLQKNQMTVSVGRLILSSLFLFIFPLTFVAILANGIPRIYGNFKLKKISNKHIIENQESDKDIKNEILIIVKKLLPLAIYYTVSGQITIWLVSFFGNTTVIAQLGALSRITVLLTLFSTIFNTLIIPRFARLNEIRSLLFNKYFILHLMILFSLSIAVAIVWLFPSEILWILGKNYSDLNDELLINIIASCFGMLAGFSFSLYSSRGWAMNPFIGISLGLLGIISGAFIFNMSELMGAIYYNLYVGIYGAIINFTFGTIKINKLI